ncbi:MAG: hypothetical protein ACLFM7_02730 [Bacteroidales bacterium]
MNNNFINTYPQSIFEFEKEESEFSGTAVKIEPKFVIFSSRINITEFLENWISVNPDYFPTGTSIQLYKYEEYEKSLEHIEDEDSLDFHDIDSKPKFKSVQKKVKIRSVSKYKPKGLI